MGGLDLKRYVIVFITFSNLFGKVVHTYPFSRRIQILPLWRAFSDTSVFSWRKRRIRVDGTLGSLASQRSSYLHEEKSKKSYFLSLIAERRRFVAIEKLGG